MREVEKEEEEVALGFTFSIHFHGLLQKLSKTSPVLRGSIEQSEDHEDDEHYEDVDDEHYEDAPDSEDEGDSGEEEQKGGCRIDEIASLVQAVRASPCSSTAWLHVTCKVFRWQ